MRNERGGVLAGTVIIMKRLTNGCMLIIVTWLAAAVIDCAGPRSSPNPNIIAVASLATIAGRWEGVSRTVPEMRDDAAVMLIIREEGRFNFISNRGTEVLLGTGILMNVDGAVVARGNQGTALLTLHDQAGGPVLVVQAALTNGHHYYLEMTRNR